MQGAEGQGDAFLFVILLGLGLLFDFVRGFHEPASALAPIIYTRALSLRWAVLFAWILTLVATFIVPVFPSNMVSAVIEPQVATYAVLASALVAAIAWNLASWFFRLPTVTSHALIGGFLGAGLAAGGSSAVKWIGLERPLLGIVLSFLVCLGFSYFLARCFSFLGSHPPSSRVAGTLRKLQLVPAGVYFFFFEGMIATRTTSILLVLLASKGSLNSRGSAISFTTPEFLWIFAIAAFSSLITYLGTLSGGRRLIRTVGSRITRLRPVDGVVAATTLLIPLGLGPFGIPTAKTPSIAGAIVGTGAARGRSAVRWSVPTCMGLGWVLTIPAAAALGFTCHHGIRVLFEILGLPR